jgi:hypothetical protein
MPKNSEARLKANSKWDKENTTSFTIKMNKADYKPLNEYLQANNTISRNAFVISAIQEKLNNISKNAQNSN